MRLNRLWSFCLPFVILVVVGCGKSAEKELIRPVRAIKVGDLGLSRHGLSRPSGPCRGSGTFVSGSGAAGRLADQRR